MGTALVGDHVMELLAFIDSDGFIHINSNIKDEDAMWRVHLGWPSQEEIEWHKNLGARVVKVEVTIKEESK